MVRQGIQLSLFVLQKALYQQEYADSQCDYGRDKEKPLVFVGYFHMPGLVYLFKCQKNVK
jgi:hypothetical protein